MKTPETVATKGGQSSGLAVAPCSAFWPLWKHMHDEHGLLLLESELAEIVRVVNNRQEERLHWWINNAEALAKERGDLFRAGESLRAIGDGYFTASQREAWDAAAQPIRDMIASMPSPNTKISHAEDKP